MLVVFPIVAHLKEEQPNAHKALKYCSNENRNIPQGIVSSLESAGAVTLGESKYTILTYGLENS